MTGRVSFRLWALVLVLCAASGVSSVSELEWTSLERAAGVVAARANRQAKIRTRAHPKNDESNTDEVPEMTDCLWDGEHCRANPVKITDVFAKSDAPYVRFISQYAKCSLSIDAKSCDSSPGCLWSGKQCLFLEVDLGHKDSVCVKAAPSFFYLITYGATCLYMNTEERCTKDPYCVWDDVAQLCDTDGLLAWTGLSSPKFQKISAEMAPEWQAAFKSKFDVFAEDFQSDAVLEWEVPKVTCPKWADTRECDLTHALMKPTLPTTSYCAVKYLNKPAAHCNKDKLCEVDPTDGTCIASESETRTGFYEVVFPFMKTELDKEIVAKFIKCFLNKEKKKCKGKCVWLGPEQGCTARESWVLKKVADVDKSGKDVVCKYMSILGSSGCNDVTKPAACNKKDTCGWVEGDNLCAPTPVYWLSTAVEMDEVVKGIFIEVSTKCIPITTQEACVSA